jgi:hypothetical protein
MEKYTKKRVEVASSYQDELNQLLKIKEAQLRRLRQDNAWHAQYEKDYERSGKDFGPRPLTREEQWKLFKC